MRAVQGGDREALAHLVRRYHRPLLAFYYRLSGDYHLAQDLAQECFLRLVARAGLYRYPQPLRPWLYRIAVNIWRDHVRSAAYRPGRTIPVPLLWDRDSFPLPERPGGDPVLSEAVPGPDEEVWRRLQGAEVAAALRALPPEFAQVLILRFGQELTVPEIAGALGLPEGTVKSRIFHGLRHLRDRLTAPRSTEGGHTDVHTDVRKARSRR